MFQKVDTQMSGTSMQYRPVFTKLVSMFSKS